jgi:prevent-host-death family protein
MSVNIYEAKTRLSQLVAEVERTGAEVTISRHGVPVAKLVPFRPVAPPRQLGSWRGRVEISPDFDELPADLVAAFSGALP